MGNLVQVPWQPSLWLTPDTLALLVAAGNRLGTKLYIYMQPDGPTDGAWRSWERQNYLYQKSLSGGNIASNPNSGQRMHMRGGAFDLVRTDLAVQAACRAVGLIRDGSETWHWNNPRMTSMPIIHTNTSTAGGGSVPIEPEQEDDMYTDADRARDEIVAAKLGGGNGAPVYLVKRVSDGHPVLNGMLCTMAPGHFRAIGSVDDLGGIAVDLHIADRDVIAGLDGNGLPAANFIRLIEVFQIPIGKVVPGGSYQV